MKDLIQALLIFNKYSKDDISKLEKLGFEADYKNDDFFSYRFGSC